MAELPPSKRGQRNVHPDPMIDLSRRVAADPYDAVTNPEGIIDMGSSINELMQDDVARWSSRNFHLDEFSRALQYNDTQGSEELLLAAALFMNRFMRVKVPLFSHNILACNGITSLLNQLAYVIADEGDAIMIPTPTYGMFNHDITTRNGLSLIQVPFDDIPEARFEAAGSEKLGPLAFRMRQALIAAAKIGTKVAAIILANPENPLGLCYSPKSLRQMIEICAEFKVHLIVDEIYGLTGGDNFTSALSLALDLNIDKVHILWGLSKDFGCGGLRLGFMATYNKSVYEAMRTLSMFGWVNSFTTLFATRLLNDHGFIQNRYLPTLRKRLGERRELAMSALTSADVTFLAPQAGIYIWIDLSHFLSFFHSDESERALTEYLLDRSVFLEPGLAMFSTQPGWFRYCYTQSDRVFDLGLRKLLNALGELDGDSKKRHMALSTAKPMRSTFRHLKLSCF